MKTKQDFYIKRHYFWFKIFQKTQKRKDEKREKRKLTSAFLGSLMLVKCSEYLRRTSFSPTKRRWSSSCELKDVFRVRPSLNISSVPSLQGTGAT